MRRSRTYPSTEREVENDVNNAAAVVVDDEDDDVDFIFPSEESTSSNNNNNRASLVHNIASFLTLSDAASLATTSINNTPMADTWAVGVDWNNNNNNDHGITAAEAAGVAGAVAAGSTTTTGVVDDHDLDWSLGSIDTPLTPALVALSPGATPHYSAGVYYEEEDDYEHHHHHDVHDDEEERYYDDDDILDSERMEELLRENRRRVFQEKIIQAIFSQPRPLRSYCWEAYTAAKDIKAQKELANIYFGDGQDEESPPETMVEPNNNHTSPEILSRKRKRRSVSSIRSRLAYELVDWILHNVPVSVLMDILEAAGITFVDTASASFTITIKSLQQAVATLGKIVRAVWDTITHCVTNPFQVLEAIISLQFNAMGKTSEVLVSGIQSVATGVGSASSLALYKLSATANMSSSASLAGHSMRKSTGSLSGDTNRPIINKKLLRKLSAINDAALVVDYREMNDEKGGLSRHSLMRTRRMMHYKVSFRPFVATVAMEDDNDRKAEQSKPVSRPEPSSPTNSVVSATVNELVRRQSSSSSSGDGSPFMCTPQSFPPTPNARQTVILQRSQMSDDVVFLARDRLRVHDGLESEDALTRERSKALSSARELAVFVQEEDSGIELTCGRHIATKVGNMYYASARSMVAILRNCYVYFEFTILPRPGIPPEAAVATLSIGLSTAEMPRNTLVGAWQGSVGLCTTGQMLVAGQWCSPNDPAMFSYGVGATVGCLVYLDDETVFESWDGVNCKATIRFNVNGVMVSPPVSALPMTGAPSAAVRVGSPIPNTNPSSAATGLVDWQEPFPATLSLQVPSAEGLYPTVTLQSSATSVACRFSAADIAASSREEIGAPVGVAVYGVDGSIILHDDVPPAIVPES